LTGLLRYHHNVVVALVRARRIVLAGLLSVSMTSLLLVPPEHRHLPARHDNDHHASQIHRHFAPHQNPSGRALHEDGDDGEPQWLDAPFEGPRITPPVYPIDRLLAQELPDMPTAEELRRKAWVAALPSVHDPPLTAHGLRAPPALVL